MARLNEELEDRNTLAGRALRKHQRAKAPVLTGRLRLSTQYLVDGADGVASGTISNIRYQHPQEFGWRYTKEGKTVHHPGNPYIKPGAIAAIPELKAIYGKPIKGARVGVGPPSRLPGSIGR